MIIFDGSPRKLIPWPFPRPDQLPPQGVQSADYAQALCLSSKSIPMFDFCYNFFLSPTPHFYSFVNISNICTEIPYYISPLFHFITMELCKKQVKRRAKGECRILGRNNNYQRCLRSFNIVVWFLCSRFPPSSGTTLGIGINPFIQSRGISKALLCTTVW